MGIGFSEASQFRLPAVALTILGRRRAIRPELAAAI